MCDFTISLNSLIIFSTAVEDKARFEWYASLPSSYLAHRESFWKGHTNIDLIKSLALWTKRLIPLDY